MKLLLFSDLHANVEPARQIVALSDEADVLVGAGDFGNVRRDVGVCLAVLREIRKPAVLVAGNNESTDELEQACSPWPTAQILHGTGTSVGGVAFFGIGGGVPVTPFGSWSYDFSEEQAAHLLLTCPEGCVLVSHSPPKGSVDITSRGQSIGRQPCLRSLNE